jgi:predicted  nucleic acid-binding Zn-ribbon protein
MDCEEVHESQMCPACGSETFAYISRWIPAPERRQQPRRQETAETSRELASPAAPPSGMTRWLRRGAVGMAAVAAVGWAWQQRRNPPQTPSTKP